MTEPFATAEKTLGTRGSSMEAGGVVSELSPIRVLIAESDPGVRFVIRSLIESENDMEIIGEAASGGEALEFVRRLGPDLLVLEIELPGVDGLEIVRRMETDRLPGIVFVAGGERQAAEAYRLGAFDYLVKPFSEVRFRSMLERARERLRREDFRDISERLDLLLAELRSARDSAHRLWIRSRGQVLILNVDDIDWIEADLKYCRVHAGGVTHRLREPIARLEARLDPGRFVRIHRSAIVNLDHVVEVLSSGGSQSVMLKDGTRIPISRPQKLHVLELAGDEGKNE